MKSYTILYIGLTAILLLLFAASLAVGTASIPLGDIVSALLGNSDNASWTYILREVRLPQALAAVLCGASLAVSGLLLQTCFHNALAGPDVFGISSGASLGVALVTLLFGGTLASLSGFLAIVVAAFVGAMAVTFLLLFFSARVTSRVLLLIVGLMVGYVSSSIVTLLNAAAATESVRSFVFWGMASFGNVSLGQLPVFSAVILSCLVGSLFLVKPLDALLLGDEYAENLGVSTQHFRRWALLLTGLLTAMTVAYCGPVSFIGLAVPHLARLLLRSEVHRHLLPVSLLGGAVVALLCNLLCSLSLSLPLNAVTPLLGAPVIIYVIVRRRA